MNSVFQKFGQANWLTGINQNGYAYYLYPPVSKLSFDVGDTVYIKLRSNKHTGRAQVLETPAKPAEINPGVPGINESESDTEGSDDDNGGNDSVGPGVKKYGRYLVKYEEGTTCYVRPGRISPCFPDKSIIVCSATENYRRLARSQVQPADFVFEIGCSFGVCTDILYQQCKNVIGVDISETVLNQARKTYPHLGTIITSLDIFVEPERAKKVAVGCSKVFIDIGGTHDLPQILKAISFTLNNLQPKIIVVKNVAIVENISNFTKNGSVSCLDWEDSVKHMLSPVSENLAHEKLRKKKPKKGPEGKYICVYHNYSSCKKSDTCGQDHTRCYVCLEKGHTANNCGKKF